MALPLSVVIPFLNEEKRLPLCLAALERQTLSREDFEVILIDNGSTDCSAEIAKNFPGAKVLHESRPDPYLARNRGIEAACGEYIVFLDADCYAEPRWLEELREEMARSQAPIILGYLAFPEPKSRWLGRYEEYYDAKLRFLLDRQLRRYCFGHAGNMAVHRSVFEKLDLFLPMPIVGDTEIIHRVFQHWPSSELAYTPSARVVHGEVTDYRHCLYKLYECGIYSADLSRDSAYDVLPAMERWRIFQRMMMGHRYRSKAMAETVVALAAGLVSFQFGKTVARLRRLGQHQEPRLAPSDRSKVSER